MCEISSEGARAVGGRKGVVWQERSGMARQVGHSWNLHIVTNIFIYIYVYIDKSMHRSIDQSINYREEGLGFCFRFYFACFFSFALFSFYLLLSFCLSYHILVIVSWAKRISLDYVIVMLTHTYTYIWVYLYIYTI